MRTATLRISSCLLAAALAAGGSSVALAQNNMTTQLSTYYYYQVDEARGLIAEARRSAEVGDFGTANQLLLQAQRTAPGFVEIEQARRDIAIQRADRRPTWMARGQYESAIDSALLDRRLGDAERLIREAELRFPGDQTFRIQRSRLIEIRAETGWPAQRVQEARDHAMIARAMINRGDLITADRELDQAERQAPGLPEVIATRDFLTRVRYGY